MPPIVKADGTCGAVAENTPILAIIATKMPTPIVAITFLEGLKEFLTGVITLFLFTGL
jgi:hypothetical protein